MGSHSKVMVVLLAPTVMVEKPSKLCSTLAGSLRPPWKEPHFEPLSVKETCGRSSLERAPLVRCTLISAWFLLMDGSLPTWIVLASLPDLTLRDKT